jgi:hypothetical protein
MPKIKGIGLKLAIRSDILAKIEKSLEEPTSGSCHGTSKLKIKIPFYQIEVFISRCSTSKMKKNPRGNQTSND